MDLTALDARIAELQTHLGECGAEILDTRIASSITDEYKRALGHEQEHLGQHLAALAEVRALLVVLDGAKLTQAQADLLYAPLGVGGGPTVKSGVVNLAAGGSAVVTFGTAFPLGVTPQIMVTPQFNNADSTSEVSAHTVTNTGFTIRGAGNAAGNVAWIATSAGNL